MNAAQLEAALETGLELIQKVAPLAALGGPAAGAIGMLVGQIAGFAATVVPQVENDATVIASGNLASIKALQTQIEAQNAALNAQIAAS